jgi:DNA-binding NarL/FixJ family response regulator
VIRVAILAQALALRAGLNALLGDDERVEVSAQAASLPELGEVLPEIDVLVLAASRLPLELTAGLSGEPPLAVLLLTDEPRAAASLAGLPLRAWGILPLEASAEELLAAVIALHEGLVVVSPSQAGPAFNRLLGLSGGETDVLVESLTEREREVLQLLARGLANKQIATALRISEHTVKFHVSGIYAKLGASSRTEAVRMGLQQGLVVL